MRAFRPAALAACLLVPATGDGHEIDHTVRQGDATIVTLRYADGTPFSYESYEIYYGSEEIAHQVGRTDAHGNVAFIADRSGTWRLRAFSEDGHGADLVIPASASVASAESADRSRPRVERIVTGVAVLFGIFGVLSILRRRSG